MRISIQCPKTATPFTVELADDRAAVRRGWRQSVAVRCPHCGETHAARYRDLYVDGVLAGFQGDLERIIGGSPKQL